MKWPLYVLVSIVILLQVMVLFKRGGGGKMVDMYVALILAKRRTIDTIPVQWREPVLADLNAIGVDGYGDKLPAVETPTEPTE